MDRKKIFFFGTVLLIGLMFAGCAWNHNDYASSYHNLRSGFAYYGYPYYQEYEKGGQNPVFDEQQHRHHHHHH